MRALLLVLALAACRQSKPPQPVDAVKPIDAKVDAAVDTAPFDICTTCTPNQICVALYNGTCGGGAACEPKTQDCPNNACSPACETAYCPSPYQCQNRVPCGGESPLAFTCYGP